MPTATSDAFPLAEMEGLVLVAQDGIGIIGNLGFDGYKGLLITLTFSQVSGVDGVG